MFLFFSFFLMWWSIFYSLSMILHCLKIFNHCQFRLTVQLWFWCGLGCRWSVLVFSFFVNLIGKGGLLFVVFGCFSFIVLLLLWGPLASRWWKFSDSIAAVPRFWILRLRVRDDLLLQSYARFIVFSLPCYLCYHPYRFQMDSQNGYFQCDFITDVLKSHWK